MAPHSRMASSRSLAFGLAAAFSVVVTAGANAQEPPQPVPTPHPFGQFSLGVVSLTPTLQLRNIGIDSNALDLSGTEEVSSDFTATVEPGIETRYATPRLDVRV